MSNKIWFITGVSSGFGRGVSEAALAQGDTVVDTLRKESELASFEAIAPGRSRGVLLDVTRPPRSPPSQRKGPGWSFRVARRRKGKRRDRVQGGPGDRCVRGNICRDVRDERLRQRPSER
jgi:NAD(P)-dependent dehydrogenase (short-subunit alcohol dehydrogenase family)